MAGNFRTKPQICPECGAVKVRGGHNKFKCISEPCVQKRKEANRLYREANKEELKAKRKVYVAENREQVDAYQVAYRAAHKEEHAAWGKKHREEHKDRINAQRLEYRQANREEINARQKDYYERNREQRLLYAKEFRDHKMAPFYKMWDGIIQRTENENNEFFDCYGGRHIYFYEPWRKSYKVFEKYLIENLGPKPTPDHEIDRINNEAGYIPGNLKWSTRLEQMRNTRANAHKKIDLSGDTIIFYENSYVTLTDFSKKTGVHEEVVKYRFNHHADAEYILHYDYDNRLFPYKDHLYNVAEVCLMSGRVYKFVYDLLVHQHKTIEEILDMF